MAKEIYPDGSYYEGNFVNNKKSGQGNLFINLGNYYLNDGSTYEGQFKNDSINGTVYILINFQGTYKWIDNKTYTGEWKDNSLHGFGVLIKSGKKYQGFFVQDKKHGYGIYHVNNENKSIIGKFVDNAINGLAFQYSGKEIEKYMLMNDNKIIKTLDKEEIDKIKTSEEFIQLSIFIDEVKIRSNNIII